MSNLREHYLNRKAESKAARYLAQKQYDKSKVSKADWLCIAVTFWVFMTTTYLLIENLGVI